MSDSDQIIEAYLREFEACLAGTPDSCATACAELGEHLAAAAASGELQQTLTRLGEPHNAAATFNRESGLPLADFSSRLLAAAVDNIPLAGVAIALSLEPLFHGMNRFTLAIPPFPSLEFSAGDFSGCIALLPMACGVYQPGWLYALGLPLALLWSIVGLGIIEGRLATTPGKHLLGLRVTGTDGLRITARAGVVRRLSFLAGPLAWLDWLPFLKADRRRLLDHVAGTRVVAARPARGRLE